MYIDGGKITLIYEKLYVYNTVFLKPDAGDQFTIGKYGQLAIDGIKNKDGRAMVYMW